MAKLTRRELLAGLATMIAAPSTAFAQENQRLVMPDSLRAALDGESISPNSLTFSPISGTDCPNDNEFYRLVFLKDDHSNKQIFDDMTRADAIKEMLYQEYGSATLHNYYDFKISGIYSIRDGQVYAASPYRKDGNAIPALFKPQENCMA